MGLKKCQLLLGGYEACPTFDTFIANIHNVFDALPNYRKFSPNLQYSIKDAALEGC